MKVKELLEKLSKTDPELDVVIEDKNGNYVYDLEGYGELGFSSSGKFEPHSESNKLINSVKFWL